MRGLNTRRLLAATASLVLVFGVAAGGGDDDGDGPGEAQLNLTIGDSVPLTGDLSPFGPPGEKAANLAVEVINEAIQESGADHTVNIVHEDNGGGADQQAAVQAARKMVESDGATCIAGAWASADTIPTAESVTIPEGILLISPASTSDEITGLDDDGLVTRTAPPDLFQGPTLASYVDQELGGAEGKTVNIGARNDAYGTGLAGTFRQRWEELGGEVGEEVVYDTTLPSYDSEAQQITSGNPDAFVIIDFPETYNNVGPALVRTGNFDASRTFVTDGLITELEAGPQAVNGLRGTAPGAPDDAPATQAFDQRYGQFNPQNVERQTFDAQNFDAVALCYLAAVAAGSTEGSDMASALLDITDGEGTEYSWEQLADAIEALQNGEDITYVGASGPVTMDENGDSTGGVYDIYQFSNEEPEAVDEVAVVAAE